jgi:hypothetical protein
LIQKGERVSVGAMAWGEISEENNARLQFVKEKLEHRVDDGQTLAYLQERHREFLEGVLIKGDDDDPATSEKEPVAVDAGECMDTVEIEQAISALSEQLFDTKEFPFAFLQAFDRPPLQFRAPPLRATPGRGAADGVDVRDLSKGDRTAAHLHEAADNHGRARACAPESNRG